MAEPRPPALREVIWSFTPVRTPEDYTDGDMTSDYGDTGFHDEYTTGDDDDTDDSNADDEDANSSNVGDSDEGKPSDNRKQLVQLN
ncbi:hypothetical protein EVJ58_g6348 [Rhodofomes roseus]|uniref:Uncharacterized protein n=1 Tax=Rhodofomes roseus TaxID=34475 RepID=A0A4Y9YAS6_9APHY|nr:hypothetical protein EVJ58_g6348 [Rhodofomes roseus]